MEPPKFFTLSCPSCGGKLQITRDIERFACEYCGNEQIVRRSGGVVSLAPVVKRLKRIQSGVRKIQSGVDKTASELAIRRLTDEIAALEKQKDQQKMPEEVEKGLGTIFIIAIGVIVCGRVSGDYASVFTTDTARSIGVLSCLAFVALVLIWGTIEKVFEKRRAPYEEKIRKIKQELEKHKDIVSR